MISVKTSISIVSTADTNQKYASQKTIVAWAHTHAAHTVCAIVLSVSIQDIGLSISSFNFKKFTAFLSHFSAFAFSDDIGVDNKDASDKEHKNDIISAENK